MNNPDCTKCKHYYITLDERFPKACRIFNIKGKVLPSIDVKRYTGHRCPVFEQREKVKKDIIISDKIVDTFA